ncbi:hypothetical protein NE857_05725 [Nocardiopsis exhalans]|uniref:DUF4352 domain-containing protein n=1 Tax=Nocardiopsis exhalans TaxID=163604 RepID=A0ABY5D9W7_9ACTN|nr:hypothetical protein [Nocardiopsis exhalans]USY21139.1 hypothetical protein NE857_05725 [Nocardiopsis exhalans]
MQPPHGQYPPHPHGGQYPSPRPGPPHAAPPRPPGPPHGTPPGPPHQHPGPPHPGSHHRGPAPQKKRTGLILGLAAGGLVLAIIAAFLVVRVVGSGPDAQVGERLEVGDLMFEISELTFKGDPRAEGMIADRALLDSNIETHDYVIVTAEVENPTDEFRYWRGGIELRSSDGRVIARDTDSNLIVEDDKVPWTLVDSNNEETELNRLELDPGESGVVRSIYRLSPADELDTVSLLVHDADDNLTSAVIDVSDS